MTPESTPLHFIGIEGSGMAPLAQYALGLGYRVQGTDKHLKTFANQNHPRLRVSTAQDGSSLTPQHTVVISTAVKPDNLELQQAHKNHCRVIHRSDLLAHFMTNKRAILVAGTHGKTTISAMITETLMHLGADPSAIIGGHLNALEGGMRLGTSPLFVAEADESDGSFLKYEPFISVISNIDADHLDHYKDVDDIEQAFHLFADSTLESGRLILGSDHPRCKPGLFSHVRAEVLDYGLEETSRYRVQKGTEDSTYGTFVIHEGQVATSIQSPLFGIHNAKNIACCFATIRQLGYSAEDIAASIARFQGVKRRSQVIYRSKHVTIVDDYAHNPQKIEACVSSHAQAFPEHALYVFFQPHRYSRVRSQLSGFSRAFKGSDWVGVLPVFSAGEASGDFSEHALYASIRQYSGTEVEPVSHEFKVKNLLDRAQKKPIIILFVSAGKVDHIYTSMIDQLTEHHEKTIT